MKHLVRFFKKEAVLCVAALCALLSMLAVPPDAQYAGYIDVRVLCLLFCLMGVVLGLEGCGLFRLLAERLLSGCRRLRLLVLLLVLLPFFISMLVTNDVALLTFVPFALLVLHMLGKPELVVQVVVLQTLAANLGSMATPVGNPQNLYLYSYYNLSPGQFFRVLLPLTLVSLLALALASLAVKRDDIQVHFSNPIQLQSPKKLLLYLVLFLFCLLSVFRALHFGLLTALVFVCLLCFDRRLLGKIDYSLLLTFACFFVFAGNLGRIGPVREALTALLSQSTLISSALASQVISNVPAAVLLSGFTQDWSGLLAGVNIGGLGPPIASLASLISLRFYLREPGAKGGRYLLFFTLANLLGLCILLPLAAWLG